MKLFLLVIAFLFSLQCVSQRSQHKRITLDSSITKWNHSVIALEAIQNPPKNLRDEYNAQFRSRQITSERYTEIMDSMENKAERTLGTAIFLKYNGVHFLLSARHVFADNANDSNGICGKLVLIENVAGKQNDTTNQRFIESGTGNDLPAGAISGNRNGVILHNVIIESGNSEVRTLIDISNNRRFHEYFLSSKSDDIGLIALDNVIRGKRFIQTLYKRGYVPIEISDIDTTCNLNRLDSVFCIGYPQESIVEQHPSSAARAAYIANLKTINFISKGFVLTSPKNSNFFEAAIFTYHGFSGGPVIRENKLIGIVSGFDPELKRNNLQNIKAVAVYHSKFVKSAIIYRYLQQFDFSKYY